MSPKVEMGIWGHSNTEITNNTKSGNQIIFPINASSSHLGT